MTTKAGFARALSAALHDEAASTGFAWSRSEQCFTRTVDEVEERIGLAIQAERVSAAYRVALGASVRLEAVEAVMEEVFPRLPRASATLSARQVELDPSWHPLRSLGDVDDVARRLAAKFPGARAWIEAHRSLEVIDRLFNQPVETHGLPFAPRGPHERYRGLVAAYLLRRDLSLLAARARDEARVQGPRFAREELEILLARLAR
jgi:hypothetical protein